MVFTFFQSEVVNQHTELEHTLKKPLTTGHNLGIPFIGAGRGIARGVPINGCVVIFLDPSILSKFPRFWGGSKSRFAKSRLDFCQEI